MARRCKTAGLKNKITITNDKGRLSMVLGIVFLEGGNELFISSYSIGLTYALPYIGILEHPP